MIEHQPHQEEFEDTKRVIRILKSKVRQQKKRDKRTKPIYKALHIKLKIE